MGYSTLVSGPCPLDRASFFPYLRGMTTTRIEQTMTADHEQEMNDRAEDAERVEDEEARIAVLCTTGFGHQDLDYEDAALDAPDLTNSGVARVRPAFATCRMCGTVLR